MIAEAGELAGAFEDAVVSDGEARMAAGATRRAGATATLAGAVGVLEGVGAGAGRFASFSLALFRV